MIGNTDFRAMMQSQPSISQQCRSLRLQGNGCAGGAVRRLLAVAAAPALLMGAPAACALGLGEISPGSSLGDPLRAEIPLTAAPGEQIDASCFKLAPNPAAGDDLPWLSHGKFAIEKRNGQLRLRVGTTGPIDDPILMVGIKVGCGFELSREYTLLLGPAASAVETTGAPVAAPSPEPAAKSRPPESRGSATTYQWRTVEGENLRNMARALYPDSRRMQRRFIRSMVEANPELFRGASNPAIAALPAGTVLAVPDLRRLAAVPAEAVSARKQAAMADDGAAIRPEPKGPQSARREAPTRDRLTIEGRPDSALDLKLRPSLDLARSRSADDVQRDQLRQERRLQAALEDRIVMQLELTERIRRLEETLASLKTNLNQIDRELQERQAGGTTSGMGASAGIPAVRAAPPQTGPTSVKAQQAGRTAMPDWLLFTLLTAMSFGLLLLVRARSRRAQPSAPATKESAPSVKVAVPLTTDTPLPPPPQRRADAIKKPIHAAAEPAIEVAEHESALELAEIMLSFGRVQGAAQTLADYIESNPKQAVHPWLKLLDVYRDAGRREEFDTLARRLHQTFNIEVMPWDPGTPRRFAESLEGYPHVVARLVSTWGSQECVDYLNQLVKDNRDGMRSGFPATALQEIMLLIAVLEQRRSAHPEGTRQTA